MGLIGRPQGRESADPLAAGLSITERRVGLLVAGGCSDRAIADRLLLTVQAVEWSVAKLCRSLGVDSREELRALLGELSAG